MLSYSPNTFIYKSNWNARLKSLSFSILFSFDMKFIKIQIYNPYHSSYWDLLLSVLDLTVQFLNPVCQLAFMDY